MTPRRSYGEGCAVAHGLELVGERWALLIVRELLLGPKRFGALEAGVLQASANMLSQRLREMEGAGVVRHIRLGPPADTWAWELTVWGYELEPIVLALGLWARRSPSIDEEGPYSPDALMLHLKARYVPEADQVSGIYEMVLGDEHYSISIDGTSLQITRGAPISPDMTMETDTQTLADVVKGRKTFDHVVENGLLTLTGARDAAVALLHAR